MTKNLTTLYFILIVLVFLSCHQTPDTIGLKQGINHIYPSTKTIFPDKIPAPTIKWRTLSRDIDYFKLFFTDTSGNNILVSKTSQSFWHPGQGKWNKIKNASTAVELTIFAYTKGKAISYGKTDFSFSSDPVDGMIFYRNVPLPFSYANKNKEMLSWHLGDVSDGNSKCVMTGIPVCANCHSFTADGSTIAMDVDYSNDKGNYAIATIEKNTTLTPDKIISWSDYKREDGDFTFALLSQISPDGRFVLSTVKDRSIFVPVDNLEYSQLFFPFKGILAVYDRETGEFWSLPGADDPDYVQSNPCWSPDGKHILFTRSERYYDPEAEASNSAVISSGFAEEFTSGRQGFQYDIYRIPFNDGKGGVAEPLIGASKNGKSNYFPRYTPDGKWIVFCQADNFMLLQSDSKLYMLPTGGGEARLMNCNTTNMNSWHSFSPNGKWMVFSSKANGPFTQLMLCHIDENGMDSPPVLLESLQETNRAANIPEFVNIAYEDVDKITDAFTETGNYYLRSATELYMLNEKSRSEAYFNKAIELDPDNYSTHFLKIRLHRNVSPEELYELIKKINEHVVSNPLDSKAILDRAEVYMKLNRYDLALADCQKVLNISPGDQRAMTLMASLQNQSGDEKEALKTLNEIIKQYPENASAWSQRGLVHYKAQRFQQAISDAEKAISLENKNCEYYINLGIYRAQSGDLASAEKDLARALDIDPDFYYALYIKGMIHRQKQEYDKAKHYFKQALNSFEIFINENPAQKPIITRSMITAEINRY